jgi:hypothetical protein
MQELYIETRPLKVVEGGEVALSPENIHVITTFYEVLQGQWCEMFFV